MTRYSSRVLAGKDSCPRSCLGPFPADPGSAWLVELPLSVCTWVLPSREEAESQGHASAHLFSSCCCECLAVAQDRTTQGAHLRYQSWCAPQAGIRDAFKFISGGYKQTANHQLSLLNRLKLQ